MFAVWRTIEKLGRLHASTWPNTYIYMQFERQCLVYKRQLQQLLLTKRSSLLLSVMVFCITILHVSPTTQTECHWNINGAKHHFLNGSLLSEIPFFKKKKVNPLILIINMLLTPIPWRTFAHKLVYRQILWGNFGISYHFHRLYAPNRIWSLKSAYLESLSSSIRNWCRFTVKLW